MRCCQSEAIPLKWRLGMHPCDVFNVQFDVSEEFDFSSLFSVLPFESLGLTQVALWDMPKEKV